MLLKKLYNNSIIPDRLSSILLFFKSRFYIRIYLYIIIIYFIKIFYKYIFNLSF